MTRRKSVSIWFIAVLVVLTGTGAEVGAYPIGDNIFYLATDGNDSNDGSTPELAWATLKYATDNIGTAGDTLFIMGGTYNDEQACYYNSSFSGTESDPVVLKAYGDELIIFTVPNAEQRVYIQLDVSCDYVIVDGFGYIDPDSIMWEFRGHANSMRTFEADGSDGDLLTGVVLKGIRVNGLDADTLDATSGGFIDFQYVQNAEMSGCEIGYSSAPTGNIGGTGTNRHQGDPDAVWVEYCENIIIDDNTVFAGNHGAFDVLHSRYISLTNNYVPYNWGGGIYLTNTDYSLVDGNRIYYCGVTTDFIKPALQISGSYNTIRRNVFYNHPDSIKQQMTMESQVSVGITEITNGNLIYNNTITGGRHAFSMLVKNDGHDPACSAEDNVIANNIFYNFAGYADSDYGYRNTVMYTITYDANETHNWQDSCEDLTLGLVNWGDNLFSNNLTSLNSGGSDNDSMMLFLSDNDCGDGNGEFWYWSSDDLNSGSTEWVGNISDDPDYAASSPATANWWHINNSSPCYDTGTPVDDTIGTYVEALYPGYGWDTLVWFGTAPDIGAYEHIRLPDPDQFYVSPSGSDDSLGTSTGTAWATFAQASRVLIAGDTLNIVGGTYTGVDSFKLTNSGTSANHILIRAYNSTDANINCTTDGRALFIFDGADYFDFDGGTLDVVIGDGAATGIYIGGTAANKAEYFTVQDVKINGAAGTVLDIGIRINHARSATISGHTISGCEVAGVYMTNTNYVTASANNIEQDDDGGGVFLGAGASYNLIDNNYIHDTGDDAINLASSSNSVRRNRVYKSAGAGIRLEADGVSVISNIVYNNTVFGCTGTGVELYINGAGTLSGNRISNNIVLKSTGNEGAECSGTLVPEMIIYTADAVDSLRTIAWGGNYFNNNNFRHVSGGAAYDSMIVYVGPTTCVTYSIAELQGRTGNGSWTGCIGTAPGLQSENPDTYVGQGNWYDIPTDSPCADAGMNTIDWIGLYVWSISPGYGWNGLTHLGDGIDIGAMEAIKPGPDPKPTYSKDGIVRPVRD